MVTQAALRGYLLEEALARLLRSSGYRLLTHAKQDPVELVSDGTGFRVRGRGATHQADVLGELVWTPAFSLPVRLFLEAKFKDRRCGLEVVRNAHGVIHDINENFAITGGTRPRRRYRYTYCLFSTSGFGPGATDYALAHQISLVDLSGSAFLWLRKAIRAAATALVTSAANHQVDVFPISWMRGRVRQLLGTAGPVDETAFPDGLPSEFIDEAEQVLEDFAAALDQQYNFDLLLGFPAAPFIVTLAAENGGQFLAYVSEHPDHTMHLQRTIQHGQPVWTARPAGNPQGYTLSFTLPNEIETWIAQNDDQRRERTLGVKNDFLSTITVYRASDNGLTIFQLRYDPGTFRSG